MGETMLGAAQMFIWLGFQNQMSSHWLIMASFSSTDSLGTLSLPPCLLVSSEGDSWSLMSSYHVNRWMIEGGAAEHGNLSTVLSQESSPNFKYRCQLASYHLKWKLRYLLPCKMDEYPSLTKLCLGRQRPGMPRAFTEQQSWNPAGAQPHSVYGWVGLVLLLFQSLLLPKTRT